MLLVRLQQLGDQDEQRVALELKLSDLREKPILRPAE
jgi:hypothetical protein